MWLALALLISPASLAQDAPPDAPVDELPIVQMPAIAAYVEAPYPPEAQAAGLEATVRLLIEIDEAGQVLNVEVTAPAGHGFDEAALAAVRQMSFTPAMTAEGPVAVAFEFDYGFKLSPPEPAPSTDPAAPPEAPAPPPVNLDGLIKEMGTRRALEGVRVVVVGAVGSDGSDLVGVTDAEGRFEVRGVPAGGWTLRVLSPDHVALEQPIEVVAGEATRAALWVRALAYRENEAIGLYKAEQQEVTRRTLSIAEVKQIPGTFGDPVKVIQTLPGAARSPFGTGLLVIRGSNPEDSGVYVDGVRIPLVYHLTGTTSVLSPDLIEAVDYLPGGYGTQYGRSMGGVVDIRTRETFDRDEVVWGTDILDSQISYVGRLGKKDQHAVAVAARRSYIDAFLPLFVKTGFTIKPRYWDYQLKWAPTISEESHLSAFVYGFDDVLSISTPSDVAQGSDQDAQGDFLTRYSTHRAVVKWDRELSDTVQLRVTPSLGEDFARLNFGPFLLDSWNTVLEVRAEASITPTPAVELVPGLDLIGGWWKFEFQAPFTLDQADATLAEREEVYLDGHGTAWAPDAYLKINLRPLEDRERLLITPAIRYDVLRLTYAGSITGDGAAPYTITAADPRIQARFQASDALTLKGGTGLYNQPPQPAESVGVGTDSPGTEFERSWATTVGFEHHVTPAVEWDLELFYKDMSRLIVVNESFGDVGTNPFINGGMGKAYGAELIVRHAKSGPFFGWISYTWSRSLRRDCESCDEYPFEFDQPHIFSAQGGYDLPYDFSVSAQVQYTSGNPDSSYNAGVYDVDSDAYNLFRIGGYNDERLPSYFQTSLRLDRLWTFKNWQASTYVDLMNVVKGVNPEFTLYNYDGTQKAYVRGLPFIPNVGIEARFYP